MSLTEDIELVQRPGQLFKGRIGPRFDTLMLMRRTQHEMRTIGFVRRSKLGTEWRGYGYAAFGVQSVLMRAEELSHPPPVAFPV